MRISFNDMKVKYEEGVRVAQGIDFTKYPKLVEECGKFLVEAVKWLLHYEDIFTQKQARAFIKALDSMINDVYKITKEVVA